MGSSTSLHAVTPVTIPPTRPFTRSPAEPRKPPVWPAVTAWCLEHLPLVKAIAIRVHENLPVHVDLDDLVHAGIIGLFDAATKFNPEKAGRILELRQAPH